MKSPCPIILLIVGVIICTGPYAFSQKIEVSASRSQVFFTTAIMHKVFGHDANHYYVIKFHSNQYYLEKLDADLNPLLEKPIKLFQGVKTYELEYVVHFYQELYIFFSRTRLNDITLYYQKIDKTNLTPVTEPIEVVTVKTIKGAWADFHFALSRNQTKLLVAARTKLKWFDKAQFNEYFVFGENLSLVWRRDDSFEFRGAGPRDNRYLVDEMGNVSIMSLVKEEWLLSLIRKVKNLYTIYRYTNEGKDFNKYDITLPKMYIRGLRMIGGEQGELICAGFYSEEFKIGIRGTFFFTIDPVSGRIYERVLNPFDDALMAQLVASEEVMMKSGELINYNITDMVLRNQGKIIIVAEQVYHQPYDTYNNLIVTCYDISGQVYWTRLVEKNQDYHFRMVDSTMVEMEDYRDFVMETGYLNRELENFCSYALLAPLDRSEIILFFNDDKRNLDPAERKRAFSNPKRSYLLAVTLDEFGNMSRKPLAEWQRKAYFPEPIRFYDTLYETIVIPAFRNRKFNYYKITADF
jgi:hypothetical protein